MGMVRTTSHIPFIPLGSLHTKYAEKIPKKNVIIVAMAAIRNEFHKGNQSTCIPPFLYYKLVLG